MPEKSTTPDPARLADAIERVWDEAEACLIAGMKSGAIQALNELEPLLVALRKAAEAEDLRARAIRSVAGSLASLSGMLTSLTPNFVAARLEVLASALRAAYPPEGPAVATATPDRPRDPSDAEIDEAALLAACEDLEAEAAA